MVGAEPADTVSPLDAELAQPVREAANPVRELTVRAAHLTMDQRGMIRRESCSPLDPRPDSPVHHHLSMGLVGTARLIRVILVDGGQPEALLLDPSALPSQPRREDGRS